MFLSQKTLPSPLNICNIFWVFFTAFSLLWLANMHYLLWVLITRWTVSPSCIPCWASVSGSLSIFPANINTSSSGCVLNRLAISSLNCLKLKKRMLLYYSCTVPGYLYTEETKYANSVKYIQRSWSIRQGSQHITPNNQ